MTSSPPPASKYGDLAGGITTFFTMAYIVVVNPGILSTAGTGLPFSGALTATVVLASSMTLLMGLYARLPFAVAPGMGLNAFFAYTIVLQHQVPWQTALGMVFWAGVLFLIVSATPLREHVAMAIPAGLRVAAAGGIGLLLTFIGFRNAGLIAADPVTIVGIGVLDHRAAFLLLGILVAFLFTDFFDSLSTFIGVAGASGLTEPDGRPLNLRRGLIVDACATFGAGLAGTSAGTAYVESIAGIRVGARTGRASVVTALCFLPCLFIAPLAAAVPAYATAAVLVLVGLSMFQMVGTLNFHSVEDSLPAFVTIVLMPLTLSITQGILWGFILHALLYTVTGRHREVGPILWALAVLSVGLLGLESR